MPRAKNVVQRHKRHKKILKLAKGYRGGRSKLYRTAKDAVIRAGAYAYRDRRQRKRLMRALWVTRLSAACKERGILYSRFIHGLKEAGVQLNRKMLSELAIHEPRAFDELVELAKQHAGAAAVSAA